MKLSVLPVRLRISPRIRFQEKGAWSWLWRDAPYFWNERIEVEFREVRFDRLQPSQSLRDPDRVDFWTDQIRAGRSIPALVVTETGNGFYFVQDGNHRYTALERLRDEGFTLRVKVAVVLPCPGYAFLPARLGCRETGWYSTYLLVRSTITLHRKSASNVCSGI